MKSPASSGEAVRSVVERSYRRVLAQRALRDFLLGTTIAMGGPLTLLLLGTDYFPLALLWLFGVAAFAAGTLHWVRSRPTPYRVAQRIDKQWAVEDQISTAYHYLQGSQEGGLVGLQRVRAGKLAAGGDPGAAAPFRVPETAYALLAAILLAAVLFLARYGTQETLSFQPPLPPLVLNALLGTEAEQEAVMEEERAGTEQDEKASSLESDEPAEPLEEATPPEGDAPQQIAAAGELTDEPEMPEVEGLSLEDEYGDELTPDPLGQQEGAEGQTESPSSEGEPGGEDSSEWGDENNNLLDRLEEAFKNMLSAMNMDQPKSGQPSQQASDEQSQQASQAPAQGEQAAGTQGESDQAQGSETEGGESQQMAEQFSVEEGKSESSEQEGDAAVSTAGSGEGSKDLQQAALAQAMGELTELYQQRAEEVTGEFTVETESANQAAQTPYSPRQSGHVDRGAAVTRDEIPLAYRSYIKEYFSRIRRKTEN